MKMTRASKRAGQQGLCKMSVIRTLLTEQLPARRNSRVGSHRRNQLGQRDHYVEGRKVSPRSLERQRLVLHLWRCGPRPILEALLEVSTGKHLDVVLQDFARIQPATYKSVGADKLPIQAAHVHGVES
jgi:hypothetical protein